jgi:hypothetical protein
LDRPSFSLEAMLAKIVTTGLHLFSLIRFPVSALHSQQSRQFSFALRPNIPQFAIL